MAKIEDFGEKIGGAKKDLYYKKNGLKSADYDEMSNDERNIYMDKKYIFPKYNYDELKEKGLSPLHIMYVKKAWESIPNLHKDYEVLNKNAWAYIKVCENLKEELDKFINESPSKDANVYNNTPFNNALQKSGLYKYDRGYKWNYEEDLTAFQRCIKKSFTAVSAYSVFAELDKGLFYETKAEYADRMLMIFPIKNEDPSIANKLGSLGEVFANRDGRTIKIFNSTFGRILTYRNAVSEDKQYVLLDKRNYEMKFFVDAKDAEAEREERKKLIVGQEDELEKTATKKKSKMRFGYSIVEDIDRKGKPITFGSDVQGQDYLDTFKFKGGEFGNWLSEKERQKTLNSGYEAFIDLSNALDIEPKDISLNGKLSIAFGARGSGNALAHYEPARNVINLTKMKGAGSLAHEWGHALDYYLGKEFLGKTGVSLIDECGRGVEDKFGMNKVREAMMWKLERQELNYKPDFNKEAKNFADQINFQLYLKSCVVSTRYNLKSHDENIRFDYELENLIKEDLENQKTDYKEYFQDIKLPLSAEYIKDKYLLSFNNPDKALDEAIKYASKRTLIKTAMLDESWTYKEVLTDYFKSAKEMDGMYSKAGHGYWQSDEEMFARAFACYVTDKLNEKGIISPYLSGHSEMCNSIPRGEERIAITKAIDKMITNIKEEGLFKEKEFDHTLISERHVEPEITMLGDIKIGDMMYIPNETWKEKISDLCEYKDKEDACHQYVEELGLTGDAKDKLSELLINEEQLER